MSRRGSDSPSTLATLRLAFSLVWTTGRREIVIIVGATVVTSLALAGQLLVGQRILDLLDADQPSDAAELGPSLAALGALLLIGAISQSVADELRIPLLENVYRGTMDDVLDVATEVELEVFEDVEFHDRLQRASLSAAGRVSGVVFGFVTLMSAAVVSAGVVIVLLSTVPLLVPIAIVGYLPIALVNIRNNRARYRLEVGLTEAQRERIYLEDVMTDRSEAKELRAYEIATTLRRWHRDLSDVRLAKVKMLVRRRLRLSVIASFVTNSVLVLTLSIAFILAGRGSISIGEAAVAIVGLQQLSSRLQSAGAAFSGVHEGMTFLRDFQDFRASLPAIRQRRPSGIPPNPPTALRVERLSYRYPGSTDHALRDVSFELRRGEIMAVVGANGSGKTTLSKLLCLLLPPATGTISWDGIDIASCDPSLVRAQISPVFQDYAQYQLTIRTAIGLGDTSRLDDSVAIRRAGEQAGLGYLIDAHRDGLDTRLGKSFSGGIDISVGQWQRMAIARALFRNAPIVILDEPSASLDPQGEADLFDLIHTLCHDRIVVFVSHRFATVRTADVVIVLDHGEVVELGSHTELMSAGRLYADMFRLQADRYGLSN